MTARRHRSYEHSSGLVEEKGVFHLSSCPAQLLDSSHRREASQPLVSMHSHVFLLKATGQGWAGLSLQVGPDLFQEVLLTLGSVGFLEHVLLPERTEST